MGSSGAPPAGAASAAHPSAAPAPVAGAPAPVAQPRAVDRDKLARLVEQARALGTDQLVVWQSGEVLAQFGQDGAPIQSMSITKSVLALAALRLIDQGKLSLEQPISALFPQWGDGEKSQVRVEHLLTHTSGLKEPASTLPIYTSRDFVAYALSSELEFKPGSKFVYGNSATNLLSGVIARASGQRADRYVAAALFKPLGITRYWWSLDRAKNAQGMAGLHVNAAGLLKLGQLVLGVDPLTSAAQPLIGRELLERATRYAGPVQPSHKRLGLLWWLVPQWTQLTLTSQDVAAWQRAGLDATFVEQMQPLVGREFASAEAYRSAVAALRPDDPDLLTWDRTTWKAGLPDVSYEFGEPIGCYASGTLGQFLVVLPQHELIAVRMRKAPKRREPRDPNDYPGFVDAVSGLVSGGKSP